MTIDRERDRRERDWRENDWLKGLSAAGKYRFIAELGRGGMAHVYLAMMRGHLGFNKLVVLKVPHGAVAEDPEMMEMFREEARLAARLNHPNIVQTYEVIQEGERDVTVMEYLDGQPLHKVTGHAKKLDRSVSCGMHLHILSEALTGLHHAHEAKDFDGRPLELVHRDISPPNVFVTFDGAVKILDFGIAKTSASTIETAYGTFKGKVRYMSPEHLLGQKVDRRSDVFAIGAMLWEAAVGESLWKGRADLEIVSAVVGNQVPLPRSVCPSVPAPLDAIVRKAMAHRRDDRYANALELQADIEAFLASRGERYTSHDVRAKMTELFAQLRAERQRLIEAQTRKVSAESTAEFVALSRDSMTMHSAARWPTSVHECPPPSSASLSIRGVDMDIAIEGPAESVRAALAPRRRAKMVGVGAVVLLAFGAALVAVRAPLGSQASQEAVAPAESASPAARGPGGNVPAAGEPRRQDVVIVVRTEPPDARLVVDGVPLRDNPWIHHGVAEPTSHEVLAEAKGHAPRRVRVAMDKDSDIMIRLVKETAGPAHAPPPRGVPARPAAGPSSPASPSSPLAPAANPASTEPPSSGPPSSGPSAGRKVVRPVDTSDPWSR
ncbi:serine/threonine protein kinase [Pendulispora rubella]|uniref:Serine/threonine protein kinase n=1 Tax=Pendulispora rubella TaxID=2741070 RepID=A0ABZ2L7K4_9BACT